MLIEYEEVEERRVALESLVDIENRVWVKVDDMSPLFAIADEDLDRSHAGKTSAVHFVRFQLDSERVAKVRAGATITLGVDHPAYQYSVSLPNPISESLRLDLA